MLSNLANRNIEIPGILANPTLKSQISRYEATGWQWSGAVDMNEMWSRVEKEVRERLVGIERLDEVEEWELLSRHYCVSWGGKGGLPEVRDNTMKWSIKEYL